MRWRWLTGLLAVPLLLGAGVAVPAGAAVVPGEVAAAAPALEVAVVVDGLDHPWDVAQAPDGTLLLDERAGGLTAVLPDGTVRRLDADRLLRFTPRT